MYYQITNSKYENKYNFSSGAWYMSNDDDVNPVN